MVKCQDCGFLTLRHEEARELCEVEGGIRYSGVLPLLPGSEGNLFLYEDRPLCFQRMPQFGTDTLPAGHRFTVNDRLEVFTKERDCAGFTEWRQGFTPKEHQELLDRQRMMEREDRRDKEMRDREDRRDREARDTQRNLHTREMLILGGLVTIAIVASTIFGGMIEAGWFSRPW